MLRNGLVTALIGAVLMMLLSCAGPRYNLYTGVEDVSLSQLPVWPGGTETPRYRFAGVLYGEQNLRRAATEAGKDRLKNILYWIVGLFSDNTPQQLQRPQSGAVDDNGIVYVTDVGTAAVYVFDRSLAEQSKGRLPVWQDATLRQRFVAPIGIAMGPDGEVLVTDADLGAVYRLDRQGNPLGSFGEGELVRPTGIARDALRNEIYVADTQGHDIKVFHDSGRLLRTVGSRGTGDGELNFPIHLTFRHDKLYVVDSMNARIQVFNNDGDHLLSFGVRGKFVGQFSRPKGITVDSEGNIYVVDSYFDYMLVFNSQGEFLLPIGGTGDEVGSFYLPAGAWIDSKDQLYVADMSNSRVVMFQFLGGD